MSTALRVFAIPFTCLALAIGLIAIASVSAADWLDVRAKDAR